MTQEQLSDKYNIGQGTVSICLRAYNVPIIGSVVLDGRNHPRKLYDEERAIEAFKAYYRERAEDMRRKAREYDDKAETFRQIYEKAILFGENV